ncbi:MAG TPA: hypothetical protein VF407_13160, partial [Polyangiaceae bacterium]
AWAGTDGTDDPGTDGNPCTTADECNSGSCVSTDGNTSYCASTCDPSDSSSCEDGSTCKADSDGDNFCFPNAPTTTSSSADGDTATTKSGCSIGRVNGPTSPVPWKSSVIGVGLALVAIRRRKKH